MSVASPDLISKGTHWNDEITSPRAATGSTALVGLVQLLESLIFRATKSKNGFKWCG